MIAAGGGCLECRTAQTSAFHSTYMSECLGCQIRALSNAPRRIRELFLDGIADQVERDQMRETLVAEYRRRKALEARAVA